jgi:hypothetical protein
MTAAQLADPSTACVDVVVIDPDRIKKLIPEFQVLRDAGDQYAAMGVGAESREIARRIVAEAQLRQLSFLCYTTGSSSAFVENIAAAKAAGYETQVTMTSRPTNEAIVRSMQRGDQSTTDRGRYAHIGELKKSHAGASRNLAVWKESPFVDKWRVYDTSVGGWTEDISATRSSCSVGMWTSTLMTPSSAFPCRVIAGVLRSRTPLLSTICYAWPTGARHSCRSFRP